jgi:histidyl-tRNA synthetase
MSSQRDTKGPMPGGQEVAFSAPRRLPGLRDVADGELVRLRRAQEGLQAILTLHGFRLLETPVLEPTELFLRKSGGELAARMYTFLEPGGRRVSLRPEFTSAVIRMFVEQGPKEPLPIRWQYAGPVFRYEPAGLDQPRQFTQVGAELIGAPGPQADAEVLALACQALMAQGLSKLQLSIGHVGALHALLGQFDLSERARLFLLGSVGELKAGAKGVAQVRHRGEGLGLFRPRPGSGQDQETASGDLGAEEARRWARGPLSSDLEHPVGSRTSEEILARLQRKLRGGDEPARQERALAFTARMAPLRGAPTATLAAARRLARRHGLDPAPLAPLEEALEVLALHELQGVEVALDLGLARGIAYYTGIVFEVGHPASPGGASLGGGGRYDGLVKALGGAEDVPALGFAYTLERVVAASGQGQNLRRRLRRVLVAPRRRAYAQALKVAAALRLGGEATEIALGSAPMAQRRQYARAKGIEALVVVEEDGSSRRESL